MATYTGYYNSHITSSGVRLGSSREREGGGEGDEGAG